jgi:hypothetical protein
MFGLFYGITGLLIVEVGYIWPFRLQLYFS